MNTATTELGVSKETTSFALPLGATINMNGNAACATIVDRFREPSAPSAKDESLAPTAEH